MNIDVPISSLLPSNKDRISFSELTNFLKCSWRYKLTYIDNLGVWVPSHFADFGTAIHAALEQFLKTKTTVSVVVATSLINFYWDENEAYEKAVPRALALEQAAIICNDFSRWFNEEFPDWEYVSAEERLHESFSHNEQSHFFKGFIDAIIAIPQKNGKKIYWVLDAKTSWSGWRSEKRRDESLHRQLVFYKHWWATREGIDINDVRTAFLLFKRTGKKGETRIEKFQISAGPKTIAKHLVVFNKALAAIKNGVAYKNRYECDYCEYANTQNCKGFVYQQKKEQYND